MLAFLVYLALTYLVAAIPFGLVVTTLRGGDVDVRAAGSGNIGTTNVARLYGWRVALTVLGLDLAKGFVPVFYARAMEPDNLPALAAVGGAAFLGHCFPVYLNFSGGKGVATGAGAMLAIAPEATLGAGAVWGGVLLLTGRSSVASLLSAAALIVLSRHDAGHAAIASLFALSIVLTHTSNLRRLMTGTEGSVVRPVGWGRTPQPSRAEIEAMLFEPPAGPISKPADPAQLVAPGPASPARTAPAEAVTIGAVPAAPDAPALPADAPPAAVLPAPDAPALPADAPTHAPRSQNDAPEPMGHAASSAARAPHDAPASLRRHDDAPVRPDDAPTRTADPSEP